MNHLGLHFAVNDESSDTLAEHRRSLKWSICACIDFSVATAKCQAIHRYNS